jgi:hypothetical protein
VVTIITLIFHFKTYDMAATVTMTSKQQKVTLTGTSVNTIDFNNVLKSQSGQALITVVSGTAVNVTGDGTTAGSGSVLLSASGNNTRDIIDIQRGIYLQLIGGAGGEVLNINISER